VLAGSRGAVARTGPDAVSRRTHESPLPARLAVGAGRRRSDDDAELLTSADEDPAASVHEDLRAFLIPDGSVRTYGDPAGPLPAAAGPVSPPPPHAAPGHPAHRRAVRRWTAAPTPWRRRDPARRRLSR